jgi:hypothetical protein
MSHSLTPGYRMSCRRSAMTNLRTLLERGLLASVPAAAGSFWAPPVRSGKKRTLHRASFFFLIVSDAYFLRHQENLTGVRIFYFSSRWISLNVDFSGVRRIGAVNATRLPWNLASGRIIFRCSRGPRGVRHIGDFRCRGRSRNRNRNRRWRRRCRFRRRSGQVSILALCGLRSRFAARKKRYADWNQTREVKVTDHRRGFRINSFVEN